VEQGLSFVYSLNRKCLLILRTKKQVCGAMRYNTVCRLAAVFVCHFDTDRVAGASGDRIARFKCTRIRNVRGVTRNDCGLLYNAQR
jgi:hypothetical protein